MKKIYLTISLLLCALFIHAQKYHDAAAFDAYGNVRFILTDVGFYRFNKDGSLEKKASTALDEYEKYVITRSADGYITKIVDDFNTTSYFYDESKKLIKKSVRGKSNYSITYERIVEKNRTPQIREVTKILDGPQENTAVTFWCEGIDDKNWLLKRCAEGGKETTEKRYITFWLEGEEPQNDGETAVSVLKILEDPLFLDTKEDMMEKNREDIMKIIKSKNIKYDRFASVYYDFANCDKTYYQRQITPTLFCYKKETPSTIDCKIDVPYLLEIPNDFYVGKIIDELAASGFKLKVLAEFKKDFDGNYNGEVYGVTFKYNNHYCGAYEQRFRSGLKIRFLSDRWKGSYWK